MAQGIKTGGRQKGTPNKTTAEIKEMIAQFVGNNLEDIQKNYDQLEPEKKLHFFEKVLKFVLPQQKETTQVIDISNLSEPELDKLIDEALKKENHEV